MHNEISFICGTLQNDELIHIFAYTVYHQHRPICTTSREHSCVLKPFLTAKDVSCPRCKMKDTYLRLLEAEKKAAEPSYLEKALAKYNIARKKSDENNHQEQKARIEPHMVFSSTEEIRCAFFSVVVKTMTIKKNYKGGLKSFIEQHHARCNRKISVVCTMSEFDLEELYESIVKAGLMPHEDFESFNAADEVMFRAFPPASCLKNNDDVTFKCAWLKGYVKDGGVMVRYSGQNERMDADNSEDKVVKSEAVSTSKKPSLSLVARRMRETRKE